MKTVGIDTNAIISYRLKREPDYLKIKQLIRECLKGKLQIYIPLPVFLEIEWVLRSYYKQEKVVIVSFLLELLDIEQVAVDRKCTIIDAINLYKEKKSVNFVDCVILLSIKEKGYELFTSDRNLKKLFSQIV